MSWRGCGEGRAETRITPCAASWTQSFTPQTSSTWSYRRTSPDITAPDAIWSGTTLWSGVSWRETSRSIEQWSPWAPSPLLKGHLFTFRPHGQVERSFSRIYPALPTIYWRTERLIPSGTMSIKIKRRPISKNECWVKILPLLTRLCAVEKVILPTKLKFTGQLRIWSVKMGISFPDGSWHCLLASMALNPTGIQTSGNFGNMDGLFSCS